MRTWTRWLLVCGALALPAAGLAQSVVQSAHNLSASGPGSVRAAVANRVCEFCHTPHSSGDTTSLWNRRASSATYLPYTSTTAVAKPGQPTGTSVLCLSCHDGTIALGEMINRSNAVVMSGGRARMPPGRGLTGTDLRHDHPISFEYSASLAAQNGELVAPGSQDGRLKLDKNRQLQCTTCHTAHDNTYGNFLVMPNVRSQMCTECHVETGWFQTSHSLSAARWNGRGDNPWPDSEYGTVAQNGCQNCHLPHAVTGGPRLLKQVAEEENCSSCHNGNVASKDVMASFDLFSSHRIQDFTAVHDPVEPAVVEDRHVECADCHDAHATQSSRSAGDVPSNVRGVSIGGAEVNQATFTYEICLRCHGDSPSQPASQVPRQLEQSNVRLEIQPNNPSFHPIAGVGRNTDVPSLIFPLTEQSYIDCTDCHNSSDAVSAGGAGPEGPHGSAFQPLLVRRYSTLDNTLESPSTYSLCYGCHSRDSILGDESFPEHSLHVSEEDTPCSACHDPHGISTTQGNEISNSHLINFDLSIVSPNANGLLQYTDNGQEAGSCDLLCHGEDHDNFTY